MHAQRLLNPAPIDRFPLHDEQIDAPQPAPGELLLRVAACAVCRTDLQLCEGDLPARRLPVTPGHQIVGHVVALGDGVRDWTLGQRAGVSWLADTCGTCRFCAGGRENLCPGARFTGWDHDGGFADFVTARADFALRLPPSAGEGATGDGGFDDVSAAPLLCSGVIGYRALKRSGIQPGGRLGLYGFGSSARLAIQIARHWGCESYVVTRSEQEQQRARDLGAVWSGGPGETPPVPLQAAVTFAPVGEVVLAALRALDRGGTVAINAIHLDRIPEFPYEDLWWERNLVSVANATRRDAQEFRDLAATIPVRTQVEVHPLTDANHALQRLATGQAEGTPVLVPGR